MFFDFKQKKETRRKGINASQLAIKDFNDITGKQMNAPCVSFTFTWFSLKPKTFQVQIRRKEILLPVCKNMYFSCSLM